MNALRFMKLSEKQKRFFLANEAIALGYGGVQKVHEISGMSKTTIIKAKKEINNADIDVTDSRIRKSGGGRKKEVDKNPKIKEEILKVVDSKTYGNPEKPLYYTINSLRKIANELAKKEIIVSRNIVGTILEEEGYTLQQNQKNLQVGSPHPDRNEQFEFINTTATEFLRLNEPVISIDCKKKELVGNFKNDGKTYNKKATPIQVLDHDFIIDDLGRVAPYGVYDINQNEGFVNLGISSETAEFAV